METPLSPSKKTALRKRADPATMAFSSLEAAVGNLTSKASESVKTSTAKDLGFFMIIPSIGNRIRYREKRAVNVTKG